MQPEETPEASEKAETVNVGYLTPQEAAARKGVAIASIYKAIERKQITAVKVLGRVAISAAEVDTYTPGSYTKKVGDKVEKIERAKVERFKRTGIPQSDEARAKISATKTGQKRTPKVEGEEVSK